MDEKYFGNVTLVQLPVLTLGTTPVDINQCWDRVTEISMDAIPVRPPLSTTLAVTV